MGRARGVPRGGEETAEIDPIPFHLVGAGAFEAALALATTSEDAGVRADAWRHLTGLRDAALRSPLLSALARDSSADVRARVAEVLRSYLPDPEVEAALLAALRSDPDDAVQDAAFLAVHGQPRGPR